MNPVFRNRKGQHEKFTPKGCCGSSYKVTPAVDIEEATGGNKRALTLGYTECIEKRTAQLTSLFINQVRIGVNQLNIRLSFHAAHDNFDLLSRPDIILVRQTTHLGFQPLNSLLEIKPDTEANLIAQKHDID
ncbi:hypothetical protein AU476_16450 [Cupriavidus sp. UYMSc13B]|nr:hypothetical protein AU476_16450 [Cupriavidus sp. UYMSc13B]